MARPLDSTQGAPRAAESPSTGAAAQPSPKADSWQGLSSEFVRERAALRLRVLSHPVRLRIVEVLSRGPANVGDVANAAGVSVSVASRHLREMHAAELVDRSRSGNFVLYALADRDVSRMVAVAYRSAVTQVRRVLALDGGGPAETARARRKSRAEEAD